MDTQEKDEVKLFITTVTNEIEMISREKIKSGHDDLPDILIYLIKDNRNGEYRTVGEKFPTKDEMTKKIYHNILCEMVNDNSLEILCKCESSYNGHHLCIKITNYRADNVDDEISSFQNIDSSAPYRVTD